MVHRKSEYMLQFHKMSKDLRWQIYRDNIQFREFRRMDNKADHYWSHQLIDDKCDCENESNDEESPFGIPPLFKLKHKALLHSYNACKSVASQEIAVQTPDWLKPDVRSADPPGSQRVHSAVNTDPDPDLSYPHGSNRPTNPSPPQSPNQSCLLSNPSYQPHDTPAPNPGNFVERIPPTPASQEPLLPSQRTTERTKTPQSVSVVKSVQRATSSHFHTSPTRTNRKIYNEGKRTHFVPYGWNDKQSDIGQKKTHNVCAPDDQVHSSALEALRLRRADVEHQLALEAERRRKLRGDKGPVNHSSIWTTEYRDKFRPGAARFTPSTRPHTSPSMRACVAHSTCHRPVSYRYS